MGTGTRDIRTAAQAACFTALCLRALASAAYSFESLRLQIMHTFVRAYQ
jgi:hypothetical protein